MITHRIHRIWTSVLTSYKIHAQKVIASANNSFLDLPENNFGDGMHKLEECWIKYTELLGEYTNNK